MTDNDKSSEIAERVRRKIAEELLRRGLDPSVIFPAGKKRRRQRLPPRTKILEFKRKFRHRDLRFSLDRG